MANQRTVQCNLSSVPKPLVDCLRLNGSKYDNIQESKSILTVYKQQLFVWNAHDSCVLVFGLESDLNQTSEYEVLLPSNPPVFEIECLSVNRLGTLLALIGHKGVMVMQVPWTCRAQKNQNPIFCRSWHVAEKFFGCTSRVDVLQASWHPGSLIFSHLVVLSSDNCLRVYDATDPQTPLQAVQLGPSSSTLSVSHKVSFSAWLGENAISFDFGPPECTSPKGNNSTGDGEFIYPVYILFANGDVCMINMPMEKTSASDIRVKGPLAMYPAAEDNYGVDACSLICLHSSPPVLVIAMASGVVYHCLLLESSLNEGAEEETKFSNQWLGANSTNNPEVSLYVHGSIELPVSPLDDPDVYFQPIRLFKDVTSQYKYHCSQVCGVHTVVIPFIQKIEECVEKGNIHAMLSQLQDNDSIVEHLLCTKPTSSVKAVPVIGVASAVVETGVTLVCLLASWEFVCIPLLFNFQSSAIPLLSSTQSIAETGSKESKMENFAQQIQQLLCRSTNTPLLKTHSTAGNKDVTSIRQYLELLWNCTNRFREEYIDPLSTAHALLGHRVDILVHYKDQQLQELERHLKEKDDLRRKAEQLAEKYEDAHAKQQLLLDRTERVMKLLQQRFPVLSTAEVAMKHDLMAMEEKIKAFHLSLEQLKNKWNQRCKKIKDQELGKEVETLQTRMGSLNLGETQLKHIKEILQQEGDSIAKLVRNVVGLKKDIGL